VLSLLSRICKTGSKTIPPTQLDQPQEIHQDVRALMLDAKFLQKMMGNSQNVRATIDLVKHWIWDNELSNQWFHQIFQKCVNDTNYDAVEPLYMLLDEILDLKDSMQRERVAMYLNSRDGLIEKAFRYRFQYPLFTYGCIKKLMELARDSSTAAGQYLQENKEQLSWVCSWLETHIEHSAQSQGEYDSPAKEVNAIERQRSKVHTLQEWQTWLCLDEEDDEILYARHEQPVINTFDDDEDDEKLDHFATNDINPEDIQ